MSESDPAARRRVSLTLNASLGDVRHLEPVVRHVVDALRHPFHEKLIAADCSLPEGRMRAQGSPDELERVLGRLITEGLIDRVDRIPWEGDPPHEHQRVAAHYFGEQYVPVRSRGGTPIYQFLYALRQCSGDYVLHLDADIAFRRSSTDWIDEGIDFLEANPKAVMVCPPGGPPKAEGWRTLLSAPRPANRWHRSAGVSTRYFLADRRRLDALRPWLRDEPDELLEASLGHTLRERGAERWTMNGDDCYAVHLHRRTPGFYEHLDDLIWAVENDVYPYWRTGHAWDLRTDRAGLLPWLAAIRWARARKRLGLG